MLGQHLCERHLRNAKFYCGSCRRYFCDACVKHEWTGSGFADLCTECAQHVDLVPGSGASAAPGAAAPGAAGFIADLPNILRYPLRPSVAVTLGGMALIALALGWLGSLIGLIVTGIELSLYFHMITRTAHGDEHLDPPDFDNITDAIARPLVWIFLIHLPLVAAVVWLGIVDLDSALGLLHGDTELADPTRFTGPLVLAALGVLLLPLLTAIAALTHAGGAILDPARWVQTLRLMGSTYAVGALAFYIMLGFQLLVWTPLLAGLRAAVPIPILTSLVVIFLGYIPMAIRARIVGAMCAPYMDQL